MRLREAGLGLLLRLPDGIVRAGHDAVGGGDPVVRSGDAVVGGGDPVARAGRSLRAAEALGGVGGGRAARERDAGAALRLRGALGGTGAPGPPGPGRRLQSMRRGPFAPSEEPGLMR
nr:hypothetical protein GCM10025732_18920 [Glycomyces mayteni]